MKVTITIIAIMLLLPCATAQEAVAALFAGSDYSFKMREWKVEAGSDGRKKVSITLAYQFPKDSRFIIWVARPKDTPLDESLYDALARADLDKAARGEAKLEFEDAGTDARFFIGLWRGVRRDWSPSGVLCDGAFVDLSPTVTSVVRHPEKDKRSPDRLSK